MYMITTHTVRLQNVSFTIRIKISLVISRKILGAIQNLFTHYNPMLSGYQRKRIIVKILSGAARRRSLATRETFGKMQN